MWMLQRGSKGFEVKQVQQALNGILFSPYKRFMTLHMRPLIEDGDFGPETERWVREFQRLSKISEDGIVGPTTMNYLFPYVSFAALLVKGLNGGGAVLNNVLDKATFSWIQDNGRPPVKSVLDILLEGVPLNALNGGAKPKGPAAKQEVDAEDPPRRVPGAAPTPGATEEKEKQGLVFEPSVSAGYKLNLSRWPLQAENSLAIAAEGTFLRADKYEIGLGVENTKTRLAADLSGEWKAALKVARTWYKGPRLNLTSGAELEFKAGWKAGGSVNLFQAELAINLLAKGRAQLVLGGKVFLDVDIGEKSVQPAFEGGVGIKVPLSTAR